MARVATRAVVRHIESLFDGAAVAGLSDRQLIERFAAGHDPAGEAAFAALVRRHGIMVLELCRQLIRDRQLAEDAFQTVFLVLARKGPSIRNPDLLGNWLYGVTLRTARKAKCGLARQRKNEKENSMSSPGQGLMADAQAVVRPDEQPAVCREEAEALHDEIGRLPNSFRVPIVLCYFEGLTLDQAARQLCCPAGTVRSRLARARAKLRRGLTRRGVMLPTAAFTAALSPQYASASVPLPLCDATISLATRFAAGHSASAAGSTSVGTLAREVLRSILLKKLGFSLLTFLVLGAVATGAGLLSRSTTTTQTVRERSPAGIRSQVVARPDEANGARKPGRMTITGRVLDPAGNPVAGVLVDVVGLPRQPQVAAAHDQDAIVVLGNGRTDQDGRFRLDGTRTTSDSFFEVYVVSASPGQGAEWAKLNPDAEQPAADIHLKPEQVIRGRLFDVTGQPAAGVEVRLESIGRPADNGRLEGVMVWNAPPAGLRTWPRPVKTDDQGRFAIGGIGPGCFIALVMRDQRFAEQTLRIQTDDRQAPKEITVSLQPATMIEGRTVAADTGQPIARTILEVESSQHTGFRGLGVRRRADDQGRFVANVEPGKYIRIQAFPPDGQPYLALNRQLAWVKGEVKKVMDVQIPRGVLIRGMVTEEGTGRPLARSSVQYMPIGEHDNILSGWQAIVASRDDGSFQIAVPPGKGHLLVFGPGSNYILEEIGFDTLRSGRLGGPRFYAHDIVSYEVGMGEPPREFAAKLRPGKTVRGRVIGPHGETVYDVAITTRLHIEPINPSWRGDFELRAREGRFMVHGLDPEKSAPVYFLDAGHQWGATVHLSGKQAAGEVIVRLEPNGQAKARFVGPDGKPVANHEPDFEILATAGRHRLSFKKAEQSELAADDALLVNVDRKHYGGLATDALGRITLPDLIPGAPYRVCDGSAFNDPGKGIQVRKDFTVKPRETLDLGDILIEKPPAAN